MSNLFIIGNGFDISHDLPTRYCDFHEYIRIKYPNAKPCLYDPKYISKLGGGIFTDITNEDIGFLLKILNDVNDDEWNELEKSLGEIKLIEYFSNYDSEYDNVATTEHWRRASFYRDNARLIRLLVQNIARLFDDWVSTIDLSSTSQKKDFGKLIDPGTDLFLTFNYTRTLEVVYNASNVCHIHGVQDEEGSILFGHNNNIDYFKENPREFLGSEENLQDIHNMLKKNTNKALDNNQAFFSKIDKDVKCIYSYGFSFSDVDMTYIKQICHNLNESKPIWYLNEFDDINRRNRYINDVKKCGFRGSFDTFKIIS